MLGGKGHEETSKTYPPRIAPTGLRAGRGAAAMASRRARDVEKVRRGTWAVPKARAPCASILDAIAVLSVVGKDCVEKRLGEGAIASILPLNLNSEVLDRDSMRQLVEWGYFTVGPHWDFGRTGPAEIFP